MSRFCLVLMLLTCLGLTTCDRGPAVELTVDFSSRGRWIYDFDFTTGGIFAWGDSSRDLTSRLTCRLVATPEPGHSCNVVVTADSVDISSTLLDSAEIASIAARLGRIERTLTLCDSAFYLIDSAALPVAGVGEWDLYRQIAKVLPSLPQGAVRPGFAWERQREMPLETSHGPTVAHLYQSFAFDSIGADIRDRECAYISWHFRYIVDAHGIDSSAGIDDLPLSGKGGAHAVLDLDAKSLLSARMFFVAPVCTLSAVSVAWEEEAELALVE